MSNVMTQASRASRMHRMPQAPPVATRSNPDRGELMTALLRSLEREQQLRNELVEGARRRAILDQEQAHRFANGIQFIVSTLERQSRIVQAPEAKEQLTSASIRILALHRIQRRIYECAQNETVAISDLLGKVCDDLSMLLCPDDDSGAIVFEGDAMSIPAAMAVPLVLSVNELITNAAKYAAGKVTVRFECDGGGRRCISVTDDGPGMPAGFDTNGSDGLGMRIVTALVGQIGGVLHLASGSGERGTRCAISF